MSRSPALHDLRMPVTIERLQARDRDGVPVLQTSLVSSAWAFIQPVLKPRLSEDSPFITHQITVRIRQALSTDCRVKTADGRAFKVHHTIRDEDDRDLQLLLCEAITS